MNKNLKGLAKLVKKFRQYKPDEKPTKPEKQPSVAQLTQTFKLDIKTMEIKAGEN
ncbi:MAG: hypothetical protein GY821_12370 [Gammaproteobacteria bacterium]|nr:hypothetical protein [Gammaproteobacteria bacterium]